jgi:hypothetical protein
MKVRPTILILAGSLAVAPLAVAQDHAVPRGGGGGGGGGGGSTGGHPGVHSSGGSSSSGGSGSSYSGSSGGSTYSPPSTAERRHPRAGTGRGGSGGGGYYPGYPGYPCYGCGGGWGYYPGYGYWGSYWWPYASYGWYGGYWGYPWGGGGATVYHSEGNPPGSVRVLVDPSEARVYVDGYYAGTVDDFDGLFQRLNVPTGRHEITLKLEGYKTHRVKIYVPSDGTVKLHYDLEKGTGETFEDLSGNAPEPELRREREADDQRPPERADSDEPQVGTGRLRADIRPPDASVYVDGAFRGTAREAASLRLPAGRHRIEIVRPGYRTEEREVEVHAGETTQLDVDLERGSI